MNENKMEMPSGDSSKIATFGYVLLIIVFGIVGGWMALAPLASSSVAMGNVSADIAKKTIQHLEGGKIDAIYVKEGDTVKKGQLLIKLRDVKVKAQLDILNSQYQDAIALFARLKAQRDNKEFILFPKELTDKNSMKDQKNIFIMTKEAVENEKIITKNKIVQLQNQIAGLNALIESKQKRLSSSIEEMSEWESLFKQRLVDKQKIRELKRQNDKIEGDISSSKSDIARLNEQISEANNQQLLREKKSKNETLIKYVEVKTAIADLKSKIISTSDILTRTSVTAPIAGTVVGFTLHTVGGIIKSGEQILEIVPKNSKLFVIVQVLPTDIDKVKIGLVANIMFSAFNLTHVHIIEGKVIHVSADSFIDEATGSSYYEAKIVVTENGTAVLRENNFILVAGMPAQAMIQLGDRTALSYLVKPFSQMLVRGFNED